MAGLKVSVMDAGGEVEFASCSDMAKRNAFVVSEESWESVENESVQKAVTIAENRPVFEVASAAGSMKFGEN